MGTLWIPGRMMGLNDIIEQSAGASKGWSAYNASKQKWAGNIALLANAKGVQAIPPGYFTYLFCEPNQRRDPSNIVAGGVKLIEDALQAATLLKNDGWTDILGFTGYWIRKAERVGCLVHWNHDACVSRETMTVLLDEEVGKIVSTNQTGGRGTGTALDATGGKTAQGAAAGVARARG
jgi:hypothetical protein